MACRGGKNEIELEEWLWLAFQVLFQKDSTGRLSGELLCMDHACMHVNLTPQLSSMKLLVIHHHTHVKSILLPCTHDQYNGLSRELS